MKTQGVLIGNLIVVLALLACSDTRASIHREQLIPILGVTLSDQEPAGTVTTMTVAFEQRADPTGLMVVFSSGPGRLSPMAQTSIQQAIYRAARTAGLSTDSWTVTLTVPHQGVTVYGNSLSAMVALTVIALAQGETIPRDRVITGGITPDGHISTAGGLALKLAAAQEAQINRVLVPEEVDPADGEWRTPFLMHVSPVRTLQQAYLGLTGQRLR